MAQVLYRNTEEVFGVILLREESLQKLEATLRGELTRLEDQRSEAMALDIRNAYEARFRWVPSAPAKPDERELRRIEAVTEERWATLYPSLLEFQLMLRNGRTLTGASINELANHPELEHTAPIALKAKLQSGKIVGELEIERSFLGRHRVTISAQPDSSDEARQLVLTLSSWASSIRQPAYVDLTFAIPRYLLVCGSAVLTSLVLVLSVANPARTESINRAHALLRAGVKQENVAEAVEILLALESQFRPDHVQPRFHPMGIVALATLFLAVLLLSFRPAHPVIGLGQGRQALPRWAFYMRSVAKTWPGFVVLNFLVPVLHPWLWRALGLAP